MDPMTADTQTARQWAQEASLNSWTYEKEIIKNQYAWLEDITDKLKTGELKRDANKSAYRP